MTELGHKYAFDLSRESPLTTVLSVLAVQCAFKPELVFLPSAASQP